MNVFWILGSLIFLQSPLFANPALDDLQSLMHQKEKTPITNTVSSKQKNLSENYYFVFIYKGSCPHCHKFAPVLKDFASQFQVNVLAYSLDNEPLTEFKGEPLTPELFQTFYVNGGYDPTVPALFLVNRHTLQAYAVLFGEAKDYELANRVNDLMLHIEERFHD